MALDKAPLKAKIKAALLAAKAETDPDNFEATMDQYAQDIADAVDDYVKGGEVVVGTGSSAGTYPVT
jgi:hypothetical protein